MSTLINKINRTKTFLANLLQITEEEAENVINKQPSLINYSTKQVWKKDNAGNVMLVNVLIDRMSFYRDVFRVPAELSEKKFLRMIASHPALLNTSEKTFLEKMEAIKSTLDLSDVELRKFVVSNPQVVLLDCSSKGNNTTVAKIAKFRSVLSMDEILDNPMILNVPAQKFTIRYMIAKNAGARDAFVNGGFMYNEKKVYARAQYLASLTSTQYVAADIFSDKFEKKFGVLDATLAAQYPLDAVAISSIEATYAANNRRPITLKPEERNAVL